VKVSTQRTEAKEGALPGTGRGPLPLESGVCATRSRKGVRKRVAHGDVRVLVQPDPTGPTYRCGFYECVTRVKSLGQTLTSPMV